MSLADWGCAALGRVPGRRLPPSKVMPMRYAPPPPVPQVEIIMLETRRGAPTSTTSKIYEKGMIYLVPEDLAASFFSCAAADPAEAHTQPVDAPNSTAEESALPGDPDRSPQMHKTRPRPRRLAGKG